MTGGVISLAVKVNMVVLDLPEIKKGGKKQVLRVLRTTAVCSSTLADQKSSVSTRASSSSLVLLESGRCLAVCF